MKEENEEKKVNKVWLFLQLLGYLVIGWFIFSKMGYLPNFLSMPLPKEMKKYSLMYDVTGYSFVNEVILNYKKDVVLPKTLYELDVFTNNNIVGTNGYYDKENNNYYIGNSKYIIEFDADTFDKKIISEKNITEANGMTYTPVKYGEVFFKLQPLNGKTPRILGKGGFEYRTPKMDNLIYEYFYDEVAKGQGKKMDFKLFAEILNQNETENISLEELSLILWLVRYNQILSWNAENKTMLYMYEDDTGRYLAKYTIGDEEPKVFGPFEKSFSISRYDENNVLCTDDTKVYLLNVETRETRDIVQLPEGISLFRYRIRDDKKIFILGLRKNENKIWFYDEATNTTMDYKADVGYSNELIIGTKGFLQCKTENGSSDYNGRFYTIDMYQKEGE